MLLLIGISLSMDTFSLSLSLGTFNVSRRKCILFSCVVGFFHFIMPLIGNILGNALHKILIIDPNRLLFIIFLFIAIEMLIELLSKEEKHYDLSFFNMVLYAFSVSIDSLTVGIGLNTLHQPFFLSSIIFSLCASVFTLLGLFVGRFSYQKLGNLSKIIGLIIIIILAIIHLLK